MMYDSLLSRSFSKHEQKQLRYGGLVTCSLIALSFCTIFKPYLGLLPILNLRLSIGAAQKLLILNEAINGSQHLVREKTRTNIETIAIHHTRGSQQVVTDFGVAKKSAQILTNTSGSQQQIVKRDDKETYKNEGTGECSCSVMERSDFCELKGDIRIYANSSTVFIVSPQMNISSHTNTSWTLRPYARKGDVAAMTHTRKWSVKMVADHIELPQCTRNHTSPAILFSLGGYSGNHFHAFTDIIVPLFSTARPFNRDVLFLATDRRPWWLAKFRILLNALSRHQVIDIDRKENVHCFTSITVGLKRHSRKELNIDSPGLGYSMKDFRQFLRASYSLRKTTAIIVDKDNHKKPQLLVISRKRSRAFTNVDEITKMAKRIGYKVVVDEPDANVSRSAQVMNSCDVVLGVHGAGLTNMVFLPENAILIQVVPFGGAEWVSKHFFEEPSKYMNIRYLEYKISINESSLMHQYPSDHPILKNPFTIQKQGWEAFKKTYFDKQNVTIDLNRLRPTLLKAFELLQH